MTIPDHPDIRAIERTGYAQEVNFVCCDKCVGEVFDGEPLFRWCEDGKDINICGDCLNEKFDALTTKEKADLLGVQMITYGKDDD